MWMWLTAMAVLLMSELLTDLRLRGGTTGLLKPVLTAASGTALFLAFFFWLPEAAFPAALLMGQLTFLVCEGLRKGSLLPAAGLCFGCGAVFLPLCLGDGAVWGYGFFIAAIALAAALSAERKGGIGAELSGLKRDRYWLVSGIPCAVVLPELMVLVGIRIAGRGFPLWTVIFACGGFLLVYLLALFLQEELVRRFALEELNAAINQWQSESREYMNIIRAQRHDFNFHLQAMTGLISSGQFDQCRAYINKLNADAADVNDIMPVHDAVIGSMLYNMREEARRRGTDILYDISYDMRDIVCNGFECNKIIGNLLRNALDALHTPEDLAYGIRLDIFKRRGNTVIRTENRFVGDPDSLARAFEAGFSTKAGHEGIGLAMVRRTAQKYGGRIYTEFGRDVVRFVVNIPDKVRFKEGAD